MREYQRTEGLTDVIRTIFPCCGGSAFFRATHFVPRETYSRRCRRCGQRWDVERRTLSTLPRVGVLRADAVDWTAR